MIFERPDWSKAKLGAMVALICGCLSARLDGGPQLGPILSWQEGRLVGEARYGSAAFKQVVALINGYHFDEAMGQVEQLDLSNTDRGLLAIAVAGHLDAPSADRALKAAETYLRGAPEDSMEARRLLNQVEVYQALNRLVMSWDQSLPGHTWVPTGYLLPARDLILDGHFEQGFQMLQRDKHQPFYVLTIWQTASFLAGDDRFAGEYQRLLDEIDSFLPRQSDRLDKVGQSQLALRPLLKKVRQYEWAVLTIPPDSLLFPRAMLEPMKTYYWWYRQMGGERPMARQGFEEIKNQIMPKFPDSVLVKIYTGQKVPWGKELRPDPVPAGAPAWAVDQVELQRRANQVVRWWFTVRQAPDGSLGGGWEDDVEILRHFAVTPIVLGNSVIESGIRRLIDGVWASGQLVNGYDRVLKDIEHSSEMSGDTSIAIAMDYGDPLYFEHFLKTTKTIFELHTGVNQFGHRHYRSAVLSATEVSPSHPFDTNYAGRAIRPAAMVAWYSRIPSAVEVLNGWSKSWSDAALAERDGKPAGIIPAVVAFDDESLKGRQTWWDPGIGSLYTFQPGGTQDEVIGKMLAAYLVGKDDAVLEGLRAQLKVARAYRNKSVDGPEGSPGWAGRLVAASAPWMATWYRTVTGDTQFDDLVALDGFGKFLLSGDPKDFLGHSGDLNRVRTNLPMITSEVRGTDRVAMSTGSLLGPVTGSPVRITEPPTFAVTWRDVGSDFAALVRDFNATSVHAWVYTFTDKPIQPRLRLWRLDPGLYELRIGADSDSDGNWDSTDIQTITFERTERLSEIQFELQPMELSYLEVVQIKAGPPFSMRMPDLAIAYRDLKLDGRPLLGRAMKGQVVVHNIGSLDAENVRVDVHAILKGSDEGSEHLGELKLRRLAYPSDLVAKTTAGQFVWKPKVPGAYIIEAAVRSGDGVAEIYTGNNVARIEVTVDSSLGD